jgi:ubiquinone/menaquinone biosynthesis C-methylase UbiE
MTAKNVVKELCPPLLWRGLKHSKKALKERLRSVRTQEGVQDLDPYWEEEMAQILETWGDGNVWNEIAMFMFQRKGKVLDIACGTGKTMSILNRQNPGLDIYGCDISDLLIGKAKARGLASEKLIVCDATKMDAYADNSFDLAYSIGSLEHFSSEGIDALVAETRRLVRSTSFHMMPVSRSGKDEGWLKTYQSFYNNSVDWWVARFKKGFEEVHVFDSKWEDEISVGKWFVTDKSRP